MRNTQARISAQQEYSRAEHDDNRQADSQAITSLPFLVFVRPAAIRALNAAFCDVLGEESSGTFSRSRRRSRRGVPCGAASGHGARTWRTARHRLAPRWSMRKPGRDGSHPGVNSRRDHLLNDPSSGLLSGSADRQHDAPRYHQVPGNVVPWRAPRSYLAKGRWGARQCLFRCRVPLHHCSDSFSNHLPLIAFPLIGPAAL